MNIIIAGGGTGGHIFPAIAIAQHIKTQLSDCNILFIGTNRGLESSLFTERGFDFRPIRAEGLVRKSFYETSKALFTLTLSFYDSYRIIKEFNPHIVLGVGGYSSGAVVMTAYLLGIPTLIHEQNSVPGLANKVLSRFSQATAISYEESIQFFPHHKVHFTGNPVREEIAHGDRQKGYEQFGLQPDRFTLFIFGGSLGAHSINNAVVEALDTLSEVKSEIQFLHQTGENDIEIVQKGYLDKGFNATVLPFIKDMAQAYAAADLIISRAGAIALAEITLCGKASILIPYPYAAGNHQLYNAHRLSSHGAAKLILNQDINGKVLSEEIISLMKNKNQLKQMEQSSKELGAGNPSARIYKLIMDLAAR